MLYGRAGCTGGSGYERTMKKAAITTSDPSRANDAGGGMYARERPRRLLCSHPAEGLTDIGAAKRFFGGVAVPGSEAANARAHGGAAQLVRCSGCGRVRWENRNGGHVEAGAWEWPVEDIPNGGR